MFYANDAFRQGYEFMFSFAFHKGYRLEVYRHSEVHVSAAGLDQGRLNAQRSIAEADSEPFTW
jgi:hypothetical protein